MSHRTHMKKESYSEDYPIRGNLTDNTDNDDYIDYRNAYWEYLVEEGYDEYSEDYM